jgi:hypothetical protein
MRHGSPSNPRESEMTPEERAFQVYEALHELPRGSWQSLILEAIREERERCAKIVDEINNGGKHAHGSTLEYVAAAIRSADTE